MSKNRKSARNTVIAASGRPHHRPAHSVSQPVERASTVLFPTYEDFTAKERPMFYGRFGTSTHRAFEASIGALEGADHVHLAPSGLAAITAIALALTEQGGHILVTDSCYDPVRGVCDRFLKRFGVETEYYDPRLAGNISALIRDNTRMILTESPGSLTFEVQDVPAIAAAASDRSVPVVTDNTWAAGYYFQPLAAGATISMMAATKYIAGHADCLLGTIATNDKALSGRIYRTLGHLGSNISADDVYQAHRGMRTLGARMPVHEANGLALARWLQHRPEVAEIMHPGLPDHPDYALWQRDFSGAAGLFGFLLKPAAEKQIAAFCDALTYFGMGYSWGGFESLLIPTPISNYRSAVPWTRQGQLMRVHAGLEQIDDLVHDLEQAFAAFHQAGDQSDRSA